VRLLTLEGVALLAGATLAGAWLARRVRMPSGLLCGAAGVVLAVLVLGLIPEIRADLAAADWPLWTGIAAALGGFGLAEALARISYGSGAAAIGAHRFFEGATLALVVSPAAILAFLAHAVAEGFAVTVTLRDAPYRTVWRWLAVACVSPFAGAVLVPSGVHPILVAVAAGAIARAAVVSMRAAVQPPESSSSAPSGTRSESRSSSHP
jgi:zinc transporter ZupT